MTDSNQTTRSVKHATFTIERTYVAAPARVFAALSTKEAKGKWFSGPAEWTRGKWELDFRVGGREVNRGGPPGGPLYTYESQFRDIIPEQRIIYTYEMYADETRISVSVATVQFRSRDATTQLVLTEQGVFLDGHDTSAQREEGTEILLDSLAAILNGGGS